MKKGNKRPGCSHALKRWWRQRRAYVKHEEDDSNCGLYDDTKLIDSSDCEDEGISLNDDDDNNSGFLDITVMDDPKSSTTSSFTSDRDLPKVSPSSTRMSRQAAFSSAIYEMPTIIECQTNPSEDALEVVQEEQLPITPPRYTMVSTMPPKFTRNRTKDSFQGSLESIDSLAESYWDPEDDDISQVVGNASATERSDDFFYEHMHFLKVQTQPRQVEVVWSTPPKK